MSLLLHCCCGPCSMYPVKYLKDNGFDLDMFWFNPNIHPEFEYNRRLENLKKASSYFDVNLLVEDMFLQHLWDDKAYEGSFSTRCAMCYDMRLDKTAQICAEKGYDSFTTTLLVSPYQNHELICETAIKKAQKYNVEFKYFDFRPGFREGQNMAREIGLYRQKYCGCINSLDESDFKEKIYKSFEST